MEYPFKASVLCCREAPPSVSVALCQAAVSELMKSDLTPFQLPQETEQQQEEDQPPVICELFPLPLTVLTCLLNQKQNVLLRCALNCLQAMCDRVVVVLKGGVLVSGERLLIFELNSQSNYTPPLHAAEAMCRLAERVYDSVQATLFVSHLQSQDCTGTPECF